MGSESCGWVERLASLNAVHAVGEGMDGYVGEVDVGEAMVCIAANMLNVKEISST